MEGWIQVIRQIALQLIKLGLGPGVLLLTLLFAGVPQVNAEGISNGHAEQVIRIGVTSRTGARRIVFVRQGNHADDRGLKPHVSESKHQQKAVAPSQLETPGTFVSKREEDPIPLAAPGTSQCSWAPVSNVGQANSERTVRALSDFGPAEQTEGDDVPRLVAPPALEPPPRSAHEAADDTRLPRVKRDHAERAGPVAEAAHSERVETSRGSGISSDARLASAGTTGLLPQSGPITIALIFCILLLLFVIMLLLRRLSVPLQPTIRVEMSHVPTISQRPHGVYGLPDGQPPGKGFGAAREQEQRGRVDETAPNEAAIWEQIVDDNVALSEELAASAA